MAGDSEGAALADVWPEVAGHLFAYLRSLGADHDLAQDVCQEVAARALIRGVAFDSAEDLTRWALVVGRNLTIDHWRRQRRRPLVELDDAMPGHVDVADQAQNRLRLKAIRSTWSDLRPIEQEALARWLRGQTEPTRTEAVRWGARRHAARARLAAMVEAAVAILAWLAGPVRARERPTQLALLAATVAVAGVVAVSVPSFRSGEEDLPPLNPPGALITERTFDAAPTVVAAATTAPRRATPAAPRSSSSTGSSIVPYRSIEVPTPQGPLIVRTRPQEPDEPLICIRNERLLREPICIEDNVPGLD